MPDPSRHSSDRNWLESILRHIPGFRGYLEQEYRRESDHLLRQHLADRVQLAKQQLDQYLRQLVDAARLDDLPAYERVRTRLDGLASKLRSAERGYSGALDFVRVREDELEQVYQVDLAMVESVESLVTKMKGLVETAAAAGATELIQKIDEVEQAFGRRGAILRGTDG